MIVGITGKSGSGKSTVSNYIKELGYNVIDVDKIHKEVSARHMDEIYQLYDKLGYSSLNHQEKIDLFFGNEVIRNKVNDITFDETASIVINNINLKTNDIIFIDAPLLFEMNIDKICDKVWYVHCRKLTNIQRIMERNNVSFYQALNRYNAIIFPYTDKFMYDVLINTEHKYENMIRGIVKDYEESNLCW